MIKANLKPEFEILESNAGFHHYRGEKRAILPNDPTHPKIWYKIFPIRLVDYEKYFGPKIKEADKIEFMKVMAYSSLELIHDPELNTHKITPDKGRELKSKEYQLRMVQNSKRPLTADRLALLERLKQEVEDLKKFSGSGK